MSASAISEPEARRALLLWPVARGHDADDDLLALLDLSLGHLGVGAVTDTELQRERGRLAVGADHPYAPAGRSARAAAAARSRAGGPLALRRLHPGRPESERRVRDLEHALLLLDDDPYVGGHAGQEALPRVLGGHHHVVGDDVLDHERRLPDLDDLAREGPAPVGVHREGGGLPDPD